jgi:SAM-dependent methyltransferase
MKEKPKHMQGITDLSPVLSMAPEMRVCFRQFAEQKGYSPTRRKDYTDKFFDWYNPIEDRRRIWVENVHSGADNYRDKHLHPRLKRKVESIEGGRFILDLGCGTGEAIIPYLKPSQHYLGVDTSRYCLEQASERFKVPILEDKTDINLERQPVLLRFGGLPNMIPFERTLFFDEAIASMVLHHVPDYKPSIESMMDMLQPGGNYFVVTFNSDKRDEIEQEFARVTHRTKRKTTGDFDLPSGRLPGETIHFHSNSTVHRELQKYSDFIHTEECAGIFQIFEGIKNRAA